jgi:hypothetical protein
MPWPRIVLPQEAPQEWNAEYIRDLHLAVTDLQGILKGQLGVGSADDEHFPNLDTAIVEVSRDASSAILLEVNNPLGREPLGVVGIFVTCEWGHPQYWRADITVTQDSKTVTTAAGTFPTDVAKGYFIASGSTNSPGWKSKIESRDNATTLTLQDAFPTATEAGINALQTYRWHDDTFWVQFNGTSTDPHWGRFLVF